MSIKLNVNDFIGKTINDLTIINECIECNKNSGLVVSAKCKCGLIKNYKLHKIISGHTKSCGCNSGKRGLNLKTHGLSRHPLYKIWANIKQRCYNTEILSYTFYGGRGVIMCDEWKNNFKPFYDWCMANGWERELEIDKDIKGDGFLYSPETCCFVSSKENNNHRTDNRLLTINGQQLSMQQISDKYNVNYSLLRNRLNLGWSVIDAVNKPVRKISLKKRRPEIRYAFGFIG